MRLQNTMHNWRASIHGVIHDDVPHFELLARHAKQQQVSTIEGWLHASRQDDDDGRLGVDEARQALVEGQRGREDRQDGEALRQEAAYRLAT